MIVILWTILFIIIALGALIWLSFIPSVSIYSTNRLKTNEKIIALTFDDGPDPDATLKILNILKKDSIKASFFVVGKNVAKYPEILKQIHQEGHLIGNHSLNHQYNFFSGPNKAVKELNTTDDLIFKQTNLKPKIYRPPFGLRIWWQAKAIQGAGYKLITWDNMTKDYWGIPADKICQNILKKARPGGVIVLHDGHEGTAKSKTFVVQALPELIKQLKKQGYSFLRIDEMFKIAGYR